MKFRDFHRNIKIRILESFLSSSVGSMIFPFMAIYLSYHFGAKLTGILLLVNVFIGIGVTFIGGYFSDQYGRKKIILLAEILRFVAFFIMMLSNSPWLQLPLLTFFMMTLNSVCWGLAGPANQAMLIDVSTPDQRKLMYSITYWANNVSIAIGGILGAFLFKDYLFELFLALTTVTGVIVFMIIFFIEESYKPTIVKRKATEHVTLLFKGYQSVWQDRLFVLYVLAGVCILSMEFQLTNYTGIRLSETMPTQSFLGLEIDGVKMMGYLRSENTILVAIIALFAVKLTSNMNDRFVLVASCLTFTIGYGFISYSNNILLLVIMMAVLTIGEVTRVPVEQSYIANIPPYDARSSYMAFNGLKFNLAMLISAITVFLGAYLSTLTMSILITMVGLTGTFIYFIILPLLDKRSVITTEKKLA
ncbi:MFS transporter [Bacillus coahuilensis m2-6]|uniref:MDR family MFS transporter n=1 Tax=Bacillus coahuilensis TaxID=408580 RepID=UPI0007503801|nr:MFS transporter [Bacillus coahuilensis]KUP09342.1 MFS transporter [Bacillus coahuilensis m2-6]